MRSKPDPGTVPPERLSLKRWSRRKLDAARLEQPASPALPSGTPADVSAVPAMPVTNEAPAVPVANAASAAPVALPPVESLTPESDFTGFFQQQGKVDEAIRRAALKQLLRDPRFNVMDGLDTYVGDYTKSDPIPDNVLKQLVQARAIFNPPKTMVNAEGHVVDVPPEVETRALDPAPAMVENEKPESIPAATIAPPVVDAAGDTGEGMSATGRPERRSAQ